MEIKDYLGFKISFDDISGIIKITGKCYEDFEFNGLIKYFSTNSYIHNNR